MCIRFTDADVGFTYVTKIHISIRLRLSSEDRHQFYIFIDFPPIIMIFYRFANFGKIKRKIETPFPKKSAKVAKMETSRITDLSCA